MRDDPMGAPWTPPAIGLGVLASGAQRVTDAMTVAAARALAESSPALHDTSVSLLPALEDTGVGVAPEQLDQMFTAFYTTKAQGDGPGAVAQPFDHRGARGAAVGRSEQRLRRDVSIYASDRTRGWSILMSTEAAKHSAVSSGGKV